MPLQVEIVQSITYAAYLLCIWGFFVVMFPLYRAKLVVQQRTAIWVIVACFVLAFGDSFHLVPRLIDMFARLMGSSGGVGGWIGFGLAASSFTLSLFYLFLALYAWRKFALRWDGWMWVLVAACVVRIVLLLFPENAWGSALYTPWKFYRNVPFVVQGLGVIILFWQAAKVAPASQAALLRGMVWSILASFIFYIATLVGTLWSSWWGMFMLPKSAAYLVLVWLLFKFEFQRDAK